MGDRQPVSAPRFPFDGEYQKALLRLLCEDKAFARQVGPYLRPEHFENGILVWAWGVAQRYSQQYGFTPTLRLLQNEARRSVDPKMQQLYQAMLDQVAAAPLHDEGWLRDSVLDFIRRNVFVSAFTDTRELFNAGRVEEAYRFMFDKLGAVFNIKFGSVDRSWLARDFASRMAEIQSADPFSDVIPTPFPWLNDILGGGLRRGEAGVWIAYYKGGKSTLLLNLGVSAALSCRKVLHIGLEGSLRQMCSRYDSSFAGVLYNDIKMGRVPESDFNRMQTRYRGMRDLVVVRAFTDKWDVTAREIESELKDLRDHDGWVPDLIIVDYGDLLRARGGAKTEYEHQKMGFRDLKLLANRGYGVWSASQAQRPGDGDEYKPHVIHARQISDCIEKVRVFDFVGSINSTVSETQAKIARLYAELYRDNAANKLMAVRYDPSRMLVWHEDGLMSPVMGNSGSGIPFLGKPQQAHVG